MTRPKKSKLYVEPEVRRGIKRWFVRGPADGSELTLYGRKEKARRRKLGRLQKQSRKRNRDA